MKKYFIYAVSALALAGCSSDDFLGGQPSPTKLTDNNVINFNGDRSSTTRAEGQAAATKLGGKFVVYGYKTNSDDSKSDVYDHYNVNWAGPAKHTESNIKGWEYVGYTPNDLSNVSGVTQTIKYWDYSAKQYDFIAFAFGAAIQTTLDAVPSGQVKASRVSDAPKYTLTGAVEDLAKVYIADRVTAIAKDNVSTPIANRLVFYGTAIPFNFRSLGTKVRIGLYETIPGYSVKDVKFYKDDNNKNAKPCLYASSATIPDGSGTMTVTFPTTSESATDYNKAHVKWSVADGNSNVVSVLELENYSLGNNNADQKEAQGDYLVRTSTDARGTSANYKTVLPGTTVGALKLKVDYTLVSIDGSGETINVKGATAVVPEVYTKWEPNYAYTYIFKISDNTNGTTGGDDPGLYPITFDAIVTKTEDGLSETITTVSEPSITTYAKGAVGNEYKVNTNIYVSVMKGTAMASLAANGVNANCALYTAKSDGYNGGITESTVANCLVNGTKDPAADTWTATDAQGKKLTVKTVGTDETANGLAATNTIEATDAPDGNAVVVKDEHGNNKNVFAKFQPTAAGTYYVFEYINGSDKYYKVIKVVINN
ncbi:MAG: membrane lipoprotein lipid attachment site-containing protein [Bacteroidaceae bacterium]